MRLGLLDFIDFDIQIQQKLLHHMSRSYKKMLLLNKLATAELVCVFVCLCARYLCFVVNYIPCPCMVARGKPQSEPLMAGMCNN